MIALYASLRKAAALDEFSWVTDGISASLLAPAYVPNLETDLVMPDASLVLASTTVEGRVVDDQGWMKHDLLFFTPFYTSLPLTQLVMHRRSDNLPLILITFAPLMPLVEAKPRSYTLLIADTYPGTARL
jgi:hypothetical protein